MNFGKKERSILIILLLFFFKDKYLYAKFDVIKFWITMGNVLEGSDKVHLRSGF